MYEDIQGTLWVGKPFHSNVGALAQVWRDGTRRARLAEALHPVALEPVTREEDYRAGEFLGAKRTKDVAVAALALLAESGDQVYPSDPGDLRTLGDVADFKAVVIGCRPGGMDSGGAL